MKTATVKDWKKKIDESLKDRARELLENFEANQEEGLKELACLSDLVEKFETSKQEAILRGEMERKNFIPNNSVLNQVEQKLFECNGNIRDLQKKIDGIFQKLTELPKSFSEIYPFLELNRK
jgi:DNA repair ATPase RecN